MNKHLIKTIKISLNLLVEIIFGRYRPNVSKILNVNISVLILYPSGKLLNVKLDNIIMIMI
jgi:hypothetical protein